MGKQKKIDMLGSIGKQSRESSRRRRKRRKIRKKRLWREGIAKKGFKPGVKGVWHTIPFTTH